MHHISQSAVINQIPNPNDKNMIRIQKSHASVLMCIK